MDGWHISFLLGLFSGAMLVWGSVIQRETNKNCTFIRHCYSFLDVSGVALEGVARIHMFRVVDVLISAIPEQTLKHETIEDDLQLQQFH